MIFIKLKQEKISNSQLTFAVIGFTIGSSLVLPPGRDLASKAWMAIILGLLEGIIFILIFTNLSQKFNMKSYFEILKKIFGKFLGTIFFSIFVLYCIHLCSLVLRNFMDFISTTMMLTTPIMAIGIAVLATTVYATFYGIGVIGRNSQVLVPLTFIAVAITVILLYKDMNIMYFKPFFEVKIKELLLASHGAASFPFGETVVFLMIFPLVKNSKKVRSSVIKGVMYGGLIILVAVLRNIAVLGIRSTIATYPSAQAVRLINIGNVITRLEVIIFFNLLTMGFIKCSVLLWCSCKGLSELLNMNKYQDVIIPVAILILFVANFQFQNVMDNVKFTEFYPLYVPFIQVGIPGLALIVAKIRKLI